MRATLIIGGNIGNRDAYLKFALYHLEKSLGAIVSQSEIYESEAWGDKAEHAFLNQVVEVETTLAPLDILKAIHNIEHMAGRTRFEQWGDRTLDIDILFLEEQIMQEMVLTVPHPRIAERKFTLVPLNDIKADFIHPVLKKSMATLLDECTDTLNVKKYQG
jgi:2-amino-4-hydroxy-6-hydroxymethyldihydropteridine diphosphokinase